MDAKVAVVNVNPSASALGSVNVESGMRAIRMRVLREGRAAARQKSGATLRLVFGNTSASERQSRPLMIGRMLFGIAMILGGFMIGSELGARFCSLSIFGVICGFMLIPGVLTRVSLTLGAAWFGFIGLESLSMGSPAFLELMLACGSVAFAVMGPGRFSADSILRRRIFRVVKRRETHRLMERRFSYKAMEYAGF